VIKSLLQINDDELKTYVDELKNAKYAKHKNDSYTYISSNTLSPSMSIESSNQEVFFDTQEGQHSNGGNIVEFMEYDSGTTFVPEENNKHIGHIDRSLNWVHPYGIQENDVISLHDGEYTRIRKVERDMTVYTTNDYITYGWWYISDSIDTTKNGWADNETHKNISIGYTGCYKK